MTVVTTVCAGTSCVRREGAGRARRPAAPASRLCLDCHERLVRDLNRLPELYEECARHLDGSGGDRAVERTSGGPLPGMPFNLRAADVRTQILAVLSAWASLVLEERDLAGPRRAVVPLVNFLTRHGTWLAAHDAAGEVSAEIAQLVRRALGVIDPTTSRRIAVGGCVEPGCTGALTAVVRPRHPQLPATITCGADASHHWVGHEWLQLSRRLGATAGAAASATTGATGARVVAAVAGGAASAPAGGTSDLEAEVRWMTAADIARLWDMPPGSVYRHASLRKWRRRSRSGRTYYHAGDVYETLHGRDAAA
ncbi:hypothetical protein [Streptomyces sp. NPDC053431]|uniref:hypothetical protein n=1 Tax=Streptomyces sp. NPDC053431 TaxID=3365703 RepID=UPI0037D01EE3